MTKRYKQLELIRAQCIKANPEIIINKHAQLIKLDHTVEYFEQSRPIRIVDVLLAVGDEQGYLDGKMQASQLYTIVEVWNLRKDDLTDQSDECIAFLADLLK